MRFPYLKHLSRRRSETGHFIGLEPKRYGHHKNTNTADFYSPMVTSRPGQQCRLRFFYFIHGEPVKVMFTDLRLYVWYASKLAPEKTPLTKISIGIREDMQQRWNKAVVPLSSTEPFRVVFRGFIGTTASRIAIDDITFDSNCVASSVLPMTTTTTAPSSPSAQTNNPNRNTTPSPQVNRRPNHGSKGLYSRIFW